MDYEFILYTVGGRGGQLEKWSRIINDTPVVPVETSGVTQGIIDQIRTMYQTYIYPIRDESSALSTFNDGKIFATTDATFHGTDKETEPKNPKIQALLDEIVNNNPNGKPQKAPVRRESNWQMYLQLPVSPSTTVVPFAAEEAPTIETALEWSTEESKPRTKDITIEFRNAEEDESI